MSEPSPTDVPNGDRRVSTSIDAWKRKLLDLSKRNRALNFRATRVSTVSMADERPAEVFRHLYLKERPMKFRAAPEPAGDRRPAVPSGPGAPATVSKPPEPAGAGVEDEIEGAASVDFVPYEAASLDARHVDDILQTASSPDQLDRSLRRLDELARSTIDEQGVNTLFLALGMLHYKDSEEAEETFRAPLILLPVELSRASARTGYTVQAGDDDPLVNPALEEFLSRTFGIRVPEIPDSSVIPDDYDLQRFLEAFREVIDGQKGWKITNDIHLAQFSFQKFVMYKDLDAHGDALAAHRVVRQLVTRSGADGIGLPEKVRQMSLDRDFAPEETFQVVDADASQLRALAAVVRGHDLVLEGPPGTGKSQTITNLIAQALAMGKSVLFVAEKMAALQVVYRRLVAAGLGEFCLELHSTKGNKRLVLRDIAAALDASLQRPASAAAATQRLPEVRAALNGYAAAVHTPDAALGLSPFQVCGELSQVLDAPKLRLSAPVTDVTLERFQRTLQDLDELAAAAGPVGNPAVHPWRDSSRTFLSEDDLDGIRGLLEDLARRLDDVLRRSEEARARFDVPPLETFGHVESLAGIAAAIAQSPGAPLSVLRSEAWNVPHPGAREMVERGRRTCGLREYAEARFSPETLGTDHADDIAYVERRASGFFGFLAFLDGRYRSIRNRWRSCRLPSYRAGMIDQAADMRKVDELRRERAALAAREAEGIEHFGVLWAGEASSWDALDAYIRWVVEFRGLCARHGLGPRAVETASQRTPDMSALTGLCGSARAAMPVLAALRQAMGWPENYLSAEPLAGIRDRVRALVENLGLGPRWATFESARQKVSAGLAVDTLDPAMTGAVEFGQLSRAFRRAFYLKWLNGVMQEREPLRAFHAMTHEQRVAEFRSLDQRVLEGNRAALVALLRNRVQERLRTPEAAAAMPFLRKEMSRQRGLSPLRKTLAEADAAIRVIKPCLMMSPLTVAQYLKGSPPGFDLVVFDEASQLPTEDAVGAVLRGRQLVVVGDPKQLPPTNFFAVMGGQVSPVYGEDGQLLFEDSESVLEDFMAAGAPKSRLKWHYRSLHESLITFSNVTFYDAELRTFPSVETKSHAAGLQFEFVQDGVYEGDGMNPVEARRVADAAVEHAKTCPNLSLGVGTFSMRQQLAILDEIERRRRDDPSIEAFFAPREQEGFFVKNLENIQGDERDVIFLSVTYARGTDGKLRYQFGPLNAQNGWRRLNVLVTRARRHMRVFSSIHGADIQVSTTESLGAKLLHDFLVYAESGHMEGARASGAASTQTAFEASIRGELAARGLTLVPQVGVAGYRVDFGVVDEEHPGQYLCGLECDGASYHASETARDRDRLRQQVLESRGWTIHRIWSTEWYKDRDGQTERILRLVEEARARRKSVAGPSEAAAPNARPDPKDTDAGQSNPGEGQDDAPQASAAPFRRADGYVRPAAAPYRFASGEGRYAGRDFLEASDAQILKAVLKVVETEAPVHLTDMISRVAGMWGKKVGPRIAERIVETCRDAQRLGQLTGRGDFVWDPAVAVQVRSRSGTNIPADRICPEEYREAVMAILRTGYGFTRAELTAEVRSLLGFSRTGPVLEEATARVIDELIAQGVAGEASTGIKLRG